MSWGSWDMDAMVTRLEAAATARVTEDVVKSWQYRGWLDSEGERRRLTVKRGRYRLGDVLQAERETRRKSGRSHRRLDPPELVDAA